jgi:monoterpene epsilon-lactone hydrolase
MTMSRRIELNRPARYAFANLAVALRSMVRVSARRAIKGARLPGWNWYLEFATDLLKHQLRTAFKMRDIAAGRRYLDSLVLKSPAMAEVTFSTVEDAKVKGFWCTPNSGEIQATMLYLHGGGYSFYPKAYAGFIALVTRAAKSRTFALDYRLAPEHCFPAQLEDALNAYRWMLDRGHPPDRLVLAGDSAGGNLAIALMLSARESKLPLPALVILLSPGVATDSDEGSMVNNEKFDYVDHRMVRQWAEWFCDPAQWRNPMVTPVNADLRGLPPLYIQAGGAEVLRDPIEAFAARAREQGADVTLETWENMVHDFQLFGDNAPQSAAALKRIGEVIDKHLPVAKKSHHTSFPAQVS